MNKKILPLSILAIVLTLTALIYWPGLKGGFIFDDYSNLGEMSKYGDLNQWENAKKFIMNGIAGPSGRPISLASFVLTASSWPVNATPFKIINLFIHLLCGFLLFITLNLTLKSYGYKKQDAIWISLLGSTLWIIHPFFVSTTLYVIQRMTQLAMLFCLLGIMGYLRGRTLLNIKPIKAYVIMSISIVLGTFFATFSKENGALLPLLILVIEFCNPNKNIKLIWKWRLIFLWLPSLAIILFLLKQINFSDHVWLNRNFNQIERLLTETRILTEYLKYIFIPTIEGNGLFQDGYTISKSLMQPISTLYSSLFLGMLIVLSFIFRRKFPLFSLAILFFFVAHLIESTILGLELYFEHRNYFASIFLFLPVASFLYWMKDKAHPIIVIFLCFIIIFTLSWMTWQRAKLWSNSENLLLYWAQKNPNSERSQSLIARHLIKNGQELEGMAVLEKMLEKNNSGLLSFQLLIYKINLKIVKEQDFINTINEIPSQRADPQAMPWIRDASMTIANDADLAALFGDSMLSVLDALVAENSKYKSIPKFLSMINFLKGMILTAQNKSDLAVEAYTQAYILDRDIDMGISIVSDLANRGYRQAALNLLGRVYADCISLDKDILNQPKSEYVRKIKELKQNIIADMDVKAS